MASSTSILCATDFSARARDAAHRAAHMARETAGTLTLMHVVPGGALEALRRGKHGRTVTENLLLGSVTQHVLAEGDTDVLIVPGAVA